MRTQALVIALMALCVACDDARPMTEAALANATDAQSQSSSGAPAGAFVTALEERGVLIREEVATSPLHRLSANSINNIKLINASSQQEGCEDNQNIAIAKRIESVDVITLCLQSLMEIYSDVAFFTNSQIVHPRILKEYAEDYVLNNSEVSALKRGENAVRDTDLSCGFFEFIYWRHIEEGVGLCTHSYQRSKKFSDWAVSEDGSSYLANRVFVEAIFSQPGMQEPRRDFRQRWEFLYTLSRDETIPALYWDILDLIIVHEVCHVLNGDLNEGSPPSARLEMKADLCALDTLRSTRPDFDVAGTLGTWTSISTIFIARQFFGNVQPDIGMIKTMNDRVRGGIDATKIEYSRSSSNDPARIYFDQQAREAGYLDTIAYIESYWTNRPEALKDVQ
jgi:hypothetical protein